MRVVIYPEPGQEGRFFEKMPNDWHIQHHQLRDELVTLGFTVEVWPVDAHKTHDVGLCFDFPKYPCLIPDRSLCVMLEPPVVYPRQYEKMNGLPFTRICTFARDFVDNRRVFYEPFPVVKYYGDMPWKIPAKDGMSYTATEMAYRSIVNRNKNICAISGGGKDFPTQMIDGRVYESYYNARRQTYLGLGKDLDLYGVGWEKDIEIINSVAYKGPIQGHKVPVMAKYKQAIVYENCYCEGYASEKQYDAYQAGVIPLVRGWKPDYPWEYAESGNWAKRIAKHAKEVAG